jgi:hypothetical protein
VSWKKLKPVSAKHPFQVRSKVRANLQLRAGKSVKDLQFPHAPKNPSIPPGPAPIFGTKRPGKSVKEIQFFQVSINPVGELDVIRGVKTFKPVQSLQVEVN